MISHRTDAVAVGLYLTAGSTKTHVQTDSYNVRLTTRSPAVARMADRTAPLQTIYAKAVVHSCKSAQPFSRHVAGKQISIAASRGLPELVPFGRLRGGNPIC